MTLVQKSLIAALAISTVLGLSSCQPPTNSPGKATLKDPKDKVSYSIGYNIGMNLSQGMKHDNVEVNPQALSQGIADAFTGTPSLTVEEMQAVMGAFQKELQAKADTISQKNLSDGDNFLAANKLKEGVVTTASGLQYKVLSKGKGSKSPSVTDEVSANYTGRLIDGTVFDSSSLQGTPATFAVNKVIPGWTEVLQLMKEGDKFQVYIPANLAYGSRSPSPKIGPNQTLIFDIELISINKK